MLHPAQLKALRHRCKLSQETLGRLIGQDQAYISKLERGQVRDVTVTTLRQLCVALAVSADVLLGLRDDAPPRTRR
jgi:transcriptional regulator with XRE-family HTH domain